MRRLFVWSAFVSVVFLSFLLLFSVFVCPLNADTNETTGTLVAIFAGESQETFTSSWIVVLDTGAGSTFDDCTPKTCTAYICQPTAECVNGGYEIGRTFKYMTSTGPNFDGCGYDFVWKIFTGVSSDMK